MQDLSFVSNQVETVYGFYPAAIESIQRYTFDWRGIYCLRDENGQRWVLRLLQHPDAAKNFHLTATLLDWLNQQGYPVPRVHQTQDQQLVGIRDGWTLFLLSFIEGDVISPEPSNLRLLSARLGQLHVLKYLSAQATRLSRCHPENIATYTTPLLNAGIRFAPEQYTRLFKSLSDSMIAILHMNNPSLAITHGDCWYMNAIKTDTNQVHLIDWDNVGIGLPVLDLGYLLLSSHFRLDDPLSIKPYQDTVQAIMEGYQVHCHLGREQIRCLLPAVHFLLAYQLGDYCKGNTPLKEDDLFLRKAQQRFNHATTIARMAEAYIRER